jgi:hypothetical protein
MKLLKPKSQAVIEQQCRWIEKWIASSEGIIYMIDNEHPFLWWLKYPWDPSDRGDMLVLLDQFQPDPPAYRSKDLISTFTRVLTTTTIMPVVHRASDPSIPKSTDKRKYLLELARWLALVLNDEEKETQ